MENLCRTVRGLSVWLLLLSTLLLQLTEGEDHVHCGPPGSEATLRLGVDLRSKALPAGQGDPSEDFAKDAQKRDAAIVVTITKVTLVLVQSDYAGISHVLGDGTSLHRQRSSCSGCRMVCFPCFKTPCGIPSFPGSLPQARPSMAMLSSSGIGVLSSSSMTGNPVRALRAVSVTMFWVE